MHRPAGLFALFQALWLPLCPSPGLCPSLGPRPALAAHTPWIPGPLSRPVDSAPGAARRWPARLPGSPSSGALSASRLKYPQARGRRSRAGDGEVQSAQSTIPEARLRREGWGRGKVPAPRGAQGARALRAEGEPGAGTPPAAWTVRRWARSAGPRSPVGLGSWVQEGREGEERPALPLPPPLPPAQLLGEPPGAPGLASAHVIPEPPLPPPRRGKPPPPCSPAPALPSGPRHAGGRVTLSLSRAP